MTYQKWPSTPPGTWSLPQRRDPAAPRRLDPISAERATLGRMITDPATVPSVAAQLVEDDYDDPHHRAVYRELVAAHHAHDLPEGDVAAYLADRFSALHRRGGVPAPLTKLGLSRLTATADAVRDPATAITHVRAESTRRRWAAAGAAVAAVGDITDPAEQATAAATALQQVQELARLDPPTTPQNAKEGRE